MGSRNLSKVSFPALYVPKQTRIIFKTNSMTAGRQTPSQHATTTVSQRGGSASLTVPVQPTAPAKRKTPGDSIDTMRHPKSSEKKNQVTASRKANGDNDEVVDKAHLSKRQRRYRVVSSSSESSDEPLAKSQAKRLGAEKAAQLPSPSVTPAPETVDVLRGVIRCLAAIPTGEIAIGAELADMHETSLQVVNAGIIKFPFGKTQRRRVKKSAKKLRESKFGIDWKGIGKIPTRQVKINIAARRRGQTTDCFRRHDHQCHSWQRRGDHKPSVAGAS
jgi:hypothetical protein